MEVEVLVLVVLVEVEVLVLEQQILVAVVDPFVMLRQLEVVEKELLY
jgi:hypothetical protein